MRVLFLAVILGGFCLVLSSQQVICEGCMDINSNNFTCNNQGCNGFRLTPSQNNSLNFATINCFNGGPCYYTTQTPIASISYVVYMFCNYTFPGCISCGNGATCNQCQNGYFPSIYNQQLELVNCQYCQDYIGGCQTCFIANMCIQCNSQYLNVFGFCYTQDGTIVGSTSKPWNKYGSTPTQIINTILIIFICLIIFFLLFKFCCQNNTQSNYHTSLEPVKTYADTQRYHQSTNQQAISQDYPPAH